MGLKVTKFLVFPIVMILIVGAVVAFIETQNETSTDDYTPKTFETFYFGTYEQDNDELNGPEKIEWLILEKNEDSLLLISKYALDYQQYNTTSYIGVCWKNCSLREWLNTTFYDTAFSLEEKNCIKVSTVIPEEYDQKIDYSTSDMVFLMNSNDLDKYFGEYDYDLRTCKPTKYAISNGAEESETNGNCSWWTLEFGSCGSEVTSMGYGSVFGAYVNDGNGNFVFSGPGFDNYSGIRPTIRITVS